jgi:hypothetical protein
MKTYSIVGLNHQKSEEFVTLLPVGTEATLVREPQNPFDPNAVAVYIHGRRVGYVPKAQNTVLAKFIDEKGEDFTMAMDSIDNIKAFKSIPAKFIRSPNSGFPMVEV